MSSDLFDADSSLIYLLCYVSLLQYVPNVGDSKRAMDEYTSEIFMGGSNTLVIHNTCEDSLLAAPIILDLAILAELFTRIQLKREGEKVSVRTLGGITTGNQVSTEP